MKRNTVLIACVLLWLTSLVPQLALSESTQPPRYGCDPPPADSVPFCNGSLGIRRRAEDLVSRLSLDEKIAQLYNSAPAIPRLGVPAYEWWSESLHGVSRHGRGFRFNATWDFNGTAQYGNETIRLATMFPQVILSAASFDSHLWFRIAQAIATEARAMFNAAQGKGMTLWAPNINIFRDPRWGRGQETPGEDPLLTSNYAVSYVRGLQGHTFNGTTTTTNPYLRASACCKHFTAHDLDNWHNITRYLFDANVTKQDLADTFQPPFQSCVQEGQASSIMCAYNRVNGVPSCANRDLLTNVARDQWHFDGYIASDCNAVSIIHESQGYADTPEDAVADVLNAGMDVECGTYTQKHAKAALEQKKVTEEEIDRALHNLFSVRMRLGLFDRKASDNLFGYMGPKQVCSKQHQDLALEAARNGIVLLKNSPPTLLPLSNSTTYSLGVIGPNADSPDVLLGNYEGFPCKTVTPLEGLRRYARNVSYHPGCNAVECSSTSTDDAVKVAKEVDYVILVMGLDQTQEREKMDREDLVLPGKQESLITSIADVAKRPVVLVLLSGGPVDVSFAKDDDKIGSILWAGYPGQAGGTAIAEVIFGDHNPGGRLPMTWYPQEFTKIPMTDMRMRPDSSGYPGRTHRFYQGKKVFEFGYGLSYSNYSYMFSSVSRDEIQLGPFLIGEASTQADRNSYVMVSTLGSNFCEKTKTLIVIEAHNMGKMDGEHPVLLFLRPAKQTQGSPLKQLIGFQRVKLKGGAKEKIEFALSPCDHLSSANEDGLMVIGKGVHYLVAGEAEHAITIRV